MREEYATLLSKIEQGLRGAGNDVQDRLSGMRQAMRAIAALAQRAHVDGSSLAEFHEWAAQRSVLLERAEKAFSDWSWECGKYIYHGGEEDAERGLERRSQFAFARELFRDTGGDVMLARDEDAEVDAELHQLAVDFHLTPDDWVPRTHTWWWWPEDGQGE